MSRVREVNKALYAALDQKKALGTKKGIVLSTLVFQVAELLNFYSLTDTSSNPYNFRLLLL